MAKSPRDTAKRERQARPPEAGTPVMVRLQAPYLAALDAFIARHPHPKPTRPEAIRRMVTEHLSAHRFLPSRPDLRKPKGDEPPRGNMQVADAGGAKRKRS